MQSKWPMVKLGEVLKFFRKPVKINPLMTYKQITVKLHHRGVVLRGEKNGQEIKSKQYLARAGQFIISRIDARNGAMGLIPPELDGAIVTNDFLLYDIDETKLFPRYFDYLTSTKSFVEKCVVASEGTTNRVRLKPEKFLGIKILLPSLEEQKRIVDKIESLMTRIEESRRFRAEAVKKAEEFFLAELEKIFSDNSLMKVTKKVEEICTKPQYGYTDSAKYEPVGIKFVRITDIRSNSINWDSVPYSSCIEKEKYLLKDGDILFARTGAPGKCFLIINPPEAIFASYLIRIRPKEGVLPKYLYWFFQSPIYWNQVHEKTKGTAQKNINGKKLSNIKVPLPNSEAIQRRIVAYLDSLQTKVDELKKLQAETEKEIEELILSILDKAFKGEL